jgi:hypothetical protein
MFTTADLNGKVAKKVAKTILQHFPSLLPKINRINWQRGGGRFNAQYCTLADFLEVQYKNIKMETC